MCDRCVPWQVYRAKSKSTGKCVALKCSELWDPVEFNNQEQEFQVWKNVEKHQHIISLEGVYHDSRKGAE